MAVEKSMEPSDILLAEDDMVPDLAVVVEDPESIEVVMDDGSVVVEFGDSSEMDEEVSHDSNLAEYIDDAELESIANDDAHSIFVIMGPSGSGKSVLLRHLIGLEAPDEGKVLLNNVAGLPSIVYVCPSSVNTTSLNLFNSLKII